MAKEDHEVNLGIHHSQDIEETIRRYVDVYDVESVRNFMNAHRPNNKVTL
jgi:hypothetical protein